jgi:hypothetical protein
MHASVMQAVHIPACVLGLVSLSGGKLGRHDSVDVPVLI